MIMVLATIVAVTAIMVVDPLTMVVVRPTTAVAATTAIRVSPFFAISANSRLLQQPAVNVYRAPFGSVKMSARHFV